MRTEQLTNALKDYILKHYDYSRENGVIINKQNGKVLRGKRQSCGYLCVNIWIKGKRKNIYYHHVVFLLNHKRLPSMIDHINGIKTDNRIENLREVTDSENQMNRLLKWKPNKDTGLSGVFKNDKIYGTHIYNDEIRFADKYQVFFHLTLLGRRFI